MSDLENALESNNDMDFYLEQTSTSKIISDIKAFIPKKKCPECEQNEKDGMNFCAFCGRQLWDGDLK